MRCGISDIPHPHTESSGENYLNYFIHCGKLHMPHIKHVLKNEVPFNIVNTLKYSIIISME